MRSYYDKAEIKTARASRGDRSGLTRQLLRRRVVAGPDPSPDPKAVLCGIRRPLRKKTATRP